MAIFCVFLWKYDPISVSFLKEKNIDELLITLDLNNNSNLNYLGKSKQIGSDLEIFADKIMIDNKTTFYLCKSYTCNLPTNSIREIKSQVKKI